VQEIASAMPLAMSTTHKHLQALAAMGQITWKPKAQALPEARPEVPRTVPGVRHGEGKGAIA
jgi:hypothetical protein